MNNYLLPPTTSGEGGFWTTFDWPSALELGAEANGLEFSGEYGFAETWMYWPTTHMVQPKENALQCEDCHADNGLMDWEALGYPGDPIEWGGRNVTAVIKQERRDSCNAMFTYRLSLVVALCCSWQSLPWRWVAARPPPSPAQEPAAPLSRLHPVFALRDANRRQRAGERPARLHHADLRQSVTTQTSSPATASMPTSVSPAFTAPGTTASGRPWDTSNGLFGKWDPLTYRYLTPEGDERLDLSTAEWLMLLGARVAGGGPATTSRDGAPLTDLAPDAANPETSLLQADGSSHGLGLERIRRGRDGLFPLPSGPAGPCGAHCGAGRRRLWLGEHGHAGRHRHRDEDGGRLAVEPAGVRRRRDAAAGICARAGSRPTPTAPSVTAWCTRRRTRR